MAFFRRLNDRLIQMKMRSKLILFFVLLISLPSAINGFISYKASTDIIVNNARDSIEEIVRKNNAVTDIIFRHIEERTISLISDPDLFALFDRPRPQSDQELVQMDRKATAILNKYFGHEQDLYTAQLVTSYFSFGSGNAPYTTNSPFVSVSHEGFVQSSIYREVTERRGSLIWIPTYDLTRAYNQSQLYSMDPKFRLVFSSARVINCSPIIDGVSYTWPQTVERPVLLINFNEDFYSKVVEQSLLVDDAYFYVVSKSGLIVTHPDIAKLGTRDSNGWFKTEFTAASGTSLVEENGEDVLIGYDISQVTDWVTVAVVPYKQLIRNLPTVRYMDLMTAAAMTIVAIFIAFMISDWLTKPIKKLLVAIQLTGAGDFNTKIKEHSQFEFRILIKKFNQMNERIQGLIKENYESTLREKEAEIMALNLQLNPHFLYNTLNIINWMAIDRDEKEISKMIVSLSTMLQFTVNNKQEIVPLRDDLEWLRSYTHIMENRYDGVFKVVYELDDIPGDCKVPKLFLQPIVENAIIHGFESLEQGGFIRISGEHDGERLRFVVHDNGKGMSALQVQSLLASERAGIGVQNVAKRIRLLYGDAAKLDIKSEEGTGTAVTIIIPLVR
ncbi:two-component system sensor histidine kinase YesM [Paenibacillus phyllosphaerae]|uniref:histidine kinase n=1 Tax=Paenibacillus phyllosphaerae TaxID=274593 RepID=A0A7W5B4L7_9BACL|nr:sensor histidine kinase [Paenibacillus phyllosphaerae]MBB3114167.1 two-component system sensor histidine kinase YesM [Paenibacillus phyllosphaerae]